MVGFLDGGPASYGYGWIRSANRADALVDEIESSIDTADTVVNLSGTVQGNDDVVEKGCNLKGTLQQQKTRGQEGYPNSLIAEKCTKRCEIVMEERFASG
ncbi:hypothetical protein HDF14_004552 [Edaphobacter lichenicola]|uniref:Uncharacterized protein n=1 Tax=Tunturiibacter gelidiferens TaxID=3069689 RepID=A0A9X0QIN2_9BACT|nr:hypothetical protein [Edaphobacter lichenicola]